MHKLIFLFLLFNISARADDGLAPDEFAQGFEILITPGSSIYRISLPLQVYQLATSPDLRDVRVFNSKGSAVPHAIRRQKNGHRQEEFVTDLPLFPVYRDLKRQDITISDNGNILSIKNLDSIYVDPDAGIKHYIIDLSHLNSRVSKLEFRLNGIESGFLGRASIESSNDLDNWKMVVRDTALAVMNYDDHQLIKNQIDLPEGNYKYLRFSWLKRLDNVKLESVRALQSQSRSVRNLNWTTFDGIRVDDNKQIYEFNNTSQLPIEQIELLLPEVNTLIDAVIQSRPDNKKSSWRTRVKSSFYRLEVQGVEIKQGPLYVGLSNDQYWQLEVKTENGMGNQSPQLRVAWESSDLYFLARGQAPFTLAYGNANIRQAVKPVNALARILNDPEKADLVDVATLGNPVKLMGMDALDENLVIPWERILLWGVLILGVLVVGFMAVRLIKQMNSA